MQEYLKNLLDTKNTFVAPAMIIGVSIILFAFILQIVAGKIANKGESITVTGSTERVVKSDMAKWTIGISERAYGENAGVNANRLALKSVENVKNYLNKNGIKDENISVQNSNLSAICELNNQGYENCSVGVKGQTSSQNIIIENEDVELIANVSGRIGTELVSVNLASNFVEYYFNKLKDIRVELLSEATKNAKERAMAVAKAGGSNIGNITSLSSGVFQVTQKNSVSVDDYGAYDTSTIDKKITATVKVNFSVK